MSSKFETVDGTLTLHSLVGIIESKIEDVDSPQKVIDCLAPFNGKKITKRHAEKLSAALGGKKVKLVRVHGMTSLDIGDYSLSRGRRGKRFYVSHEETNVVINTDSIIGLNPCYFAGANERNKARRALLADSERLSRLVKAINAYRESCREMVNALGEHDTNADLYAIEELACPD